MNDVWRLRAVRFDLPFGVGDSGGGQGGGFQISPSGGLALIDGAGAVRQSIMILLSTIPGERVMRPEYGCPLHRLAFEPNDAATAGLAMHYIRTALIRWEPRIVILSLTARPGFAEDAAHGRLTIQLEYRVRATSEIASLEFSLDLQGQDRDAISAAQTG